MHSRRRSPLFSLVVWLTIGLYALIGIVLLQPGLIAGVLGHEVAGHISEHFRLPHHRIHDLTFSFIVGTAVAGMLAQLRNPSEKVAGQVMALIPWIALGLSFVLARTWLPFAPAPLLGGLTLVATLLHPTGRAFLRSFSVARMSRVLVALVVVLAVPLLAFASRNIGLQRSAANDHAALGHYGFMAAFSLTVIGVGLLASLRPVGWKLTAWIAGFLPVLLGLTSLVLPDLDSSLSLASALACIVWGVTFVVMAVLIGYRGSHTFGTCADHR
jgi:hypothetical protein